MDNDYPDIDSDNVEWFAVDSVGNLARFTSAGLAKVPAQVLRTSYSDLDDLADSFAALPERCEVDVNPNSIDEGSLWTHLSREEAVAKYLKIPLLLGRRGIFVYDSEIGYPKPRPYIRIVSPDHPLNVSELGIGLPASLVTLPLIFRECALITEVGDCR